MLFKYALQSRKATIELAVGSVVGLLAIGLLFSSVHRWRFESALRDGIYAYAGGGDAETSLSDAASSRADDPLPHLYLGQLRLEAAQRALVAVNNPTSEPAARPAPKSATPKKGDDEDVPPKKTGGKDEPPPEPPKKEGPVEPGDPYAGVKRALTQAIKSFENAIERNGADSAVVGVAVAKLTMADCSSAGERPALIEDALKTLDRARDQEDAEVAVARAGAAFAKGDFATAKKILADVSNRIHNAGRGAVGSFYWHKGLLGLISREPETVDNLRRVHLFRPGPDTARMVATAIRVAAADLTAAPSDATALEDRCKGLQKILVQRIASRSGGESRYQIDRADQARTWNALGIGYLRARKPKESAECFLNAYNMQNDPLYRLNQGLAVLAGSTSPPPEMKNVEDYARKVTVEAISLIYETMIKLPKEREQFVHDGILLVVGLQHSIGRDGDAVGALDVLHEKKAIEDKDYHRTKGALYDWAFRLDLAITDYKKAIALRHKDTYKMEIRVEKFERTKR